MAFYSAMGAPGMGGGNFGGMGGNQSAFTNPGMDPMTLALLLRMQNANVPGANTGMGAGSMAPQGPQLPQPPQMAGGNPAMMGGAGMPLGAAASPQQGGISPQMIPLLLAMLRGQGGGAGGVGGGRMFG